MDRDVTDFNIRLRTIKLRELAVCIIITIAVLLGLSLAIPEISYDENLSSLTYLVIILIFFIWCLKGTTGIKKDFNNIFLNENRNEILYVCLINLIFAFLFIAGVGILDMFFGMTDPSWISPLDFEVVDYSLEAFILTAVLDIIFAPIIEELVFRGVLFNRLKIRIGMIPAMIISSFLFGIGHGFGAITSAFLFGICMCILYAKTDNILIPMAVHCLNNIIATILDSTPIDMILMNYPWNFIVLIITLIAAVLLIKYIVNELSSLKKVYS